MYSGTYTGIHRMFRSPSSRRARRLLNLFQRRHLRWMGARHPCLPFPTPTSGASGPRCRTTSAAQPSWGASGCTCASAYPSADTALPLPRRLSELRVCSSCRASAAGACARHRHRDTARLAQRSAGTCQHYGVRAGLAVGTATSEDGYWAAITTNAALCCPPTSPPLIKRENWDKMRCVVSPRCQLPRPRASVPMKYEVRIPLSRGAAIADALPHTITHLTTVYLRGCSSDASQRAKCSPIRLAPSMALFGMTPREVAAIKDPLLRTT